VIDWKDIDIETASLLTGFRRMSIPRDSPASGMYLFNVSAVLFQMPTMFLFEVSAYIFACNRGMS
jgi:hypothetical protein